MRGDRRISYSRDKDYRGQATTVDWPKLMYMARRRRPGALEVLQDAIEIYFPRQFKASQDRAKRKAKGTTNTLYSGAGQKRKKRLPQEYYVYFESSVARRRFKAKALKRRKYKGRNVPPVARRSPFGEWPASSHSDPSSQSEFTSDVVVWSTKTGKNVKAR